MAFKKISSGRGPTVKKNEKINLFLTLLGVTFKKFFL